MVNDSTFDLSLSFQKRLKEKIVGREKIRLSDGNQPFWNKLFTVSLWISFALFFAIGYFFLGLTWMLLFSSVAAAVFLLGLWLYSRKMAEIAVKGDVLLVKPIVGMNQVTALSSVKRFKSRSFLNLSLTCLSFYLDGVRKEIISFRILRGKDPLPEDVFKFILNNQRD